MGHADLTDTQQRSNVELRTFGTPMLMTWLAAGGVHHPLHLFLHRLVWFHCDGFSPWSSNRLLSVLNAAAKLVSL